MLLIYQYSVYYDHNDAAVTTNVIVPINVVPITTIVVAICPLSKFLAVVLLLLFGSQ